MYKIDWAYLKYPEHSYGRVQGRRNEAWKLASRIYKFPLEELSGGVKQLMYVNAYIQIAMGEADRISCNNWRRLHGIPMKRRSRK
nr:MAG TPA: protein of unknown function (DUF4869) [Caudoviricetes sp.]